MTASTALVALAVLAAACGSDGVDDSLDPLAGGGSDVPSTTSTVPPPTIDIDPRSPDAGAETARASARYFLDTYVDPDGRVVRRNQGGDTVSEGQAYAMLMAAAIDDRETFDRVWGWTQANLMRPDGMLAWHWSDGEVVDRQPASDADLDAAHALFLAARAFDDPDYRADASTLARAIIEHSTVGVTDGRLLVAGPWARLEHTVNPSYFSPLAFSILYRDGDDSRWGEVAATSRQVVDRLTSDTPHLPPDWATAADPSSPVATGDPPLFGFDASRTILRFALDCTPEGRALAARTWPTFAGVTDSGHAPPPAELRLDGTAHSTETHPATTVAAAAAARAAGDDESTRRLLDLASAQDQQEPTYYGAALVALARLGLDTDRLGTCPGD